MNVGIPSNDEQRWQDHIKEKAEGHNNPGSFLPCSLLNRTDRGVVKTDYKGRSDGPASPLTQPRTNSGLRFRVERKISTSSFSFHASVSGGYFLAPGEVQGEMGVFRVALHPYLTVYRTVTILGRTNRVRSRIRQAARPIR